MAGFSRMQVLNAMYDVGLIPVFYHQDLDTAMRIVDACAGGGALVMEFTNRGDAAHLIFAELIKYVRQEQPQVILGVGSIVDAPTAALYIGSGADFVVGPLLNAGVAHLCNRRKIPYCPGCGSVSEISEAEALGVEIVKVFPGGHVGGPSFVKALLAPMPWTSIMPTGGVDATRESIFSWIEAGAACLGMGSKLISKDLVDREDWTALRARVKECLQFVQEAKSAGERR